MKKRLGLLLAILFGLTILPLSPIVAQEDNTTTSSEPDTSQSSDPSETDSDKYEIEDSDKADFKSNLEERLKKRKDELKTKLTTAQQKRIATRCSAAQKLITGIGTKAKEVKTNRDTIYSNVLTKLTDLRDKMKTDGTDTTELDTSITELQALVDNFKSDLKELRQAGTDIVGMDCASDPTSFKASLESLRTARDSVQTDSEAIRTYLKDDVKPVLQEIRKSLGGGETSEEGAN
ncbi:hypothetical protein KDA00_04235 [Candidatus Saccharibacteria bacterium]|nr:hypothetical protein [Candidatus Saccharibacteria bacterium]